MQASNWLRRVQDSLRDSGVPESERLRFLEELQDHLNDLQEANMNGREPLDLEQSMGPPEPLAESLVESYRRGSFLGRHLWLASVAFTLGPVALHLVLTLLLGFMTLAVLYGLAHQLPGIVPESLEGAEALGIILAALGALAGVGVTAWFCNAARRNRLSWRMSLLSCAALTIGSLLLASEMIYWIGSLVTCAASLATWYLAAWRGQGWKEQPISLSRNYPFLLSGLGSLVAASACLGGYLLLVAAFVAALKLVSDLTQLGEPLTLLGLSCRFVPFVLAAYVCWRMTSRCPRRMLCSLAACLCVAIIAAVFMADISKSPEGPFNYRFNLGIAISLRWIMLGQFLTPLGVWGLLTLLARYGTPARAGGQLELGA